MVWLGLVPVEHAVSQVLGLLVRHQGPQVLEVQVAIGPGGLEQQRVHVEEIQVLEKIDRVPQRSLLHITSNGKREVIQDTRQHVTVA